MSDSDETEFSYADDEELVGQFIGWTEAALVELRELTNALTGDETKSSAPAERIYDLGHNIKGMGTSFNYALMTSAGSSLCAYIKGAGDGPLSKRIIDAHVRIFEVVLQNRIKGDGGERGAALINRLAGIVAEG